MKPCIIYIAIAISFQRIATNTVNKYSTKRWKGAGFFFPFLLPVTLSILHFIFIQSFAVKLHYVFLSLPSQGHGDKPACGQYCYHPLQKLLVIPTTEQAHSCKNTSVNKWVITQPVDFGQERATNQSGENEAGDLMFKV